MATKQKTFDHHHLHAHHAGDAQHRHFFENRSGTILLWALIFTLAFTVIEVFAGFMANSLALISDGGHMLTDSAALALALFAQILTKRPPSAKHSFGFAKAEALAAFVNGLTMLLVVAWIMFEAFRRYTQPVPVNSSTVMLIAVIGLIINIVIAWVLSHDTESLNTRAALVHVMGDLLGSIAALIAGISIYFTGWMQIDPLLSLLVALLVLKSTISILRQSYHALMHGVPEHIDYVQVGNDLEAIEGVVAIHDLHVWEMSPGHPALMGHVEIKEMQAWPQILQSIKKVLLAQHGIDHITLQAEVAEKDI